MPRQEPEKERGQEAGHRDLGDASYKKSEDRSRQWGGGRGEEDAQSRESEDQSRQSGARGRPGVDFEPGEQLASGMDQDPENPDLASRGMRDRSQGSYEIGESQHERGAPQSLLPHLEGLEYPARKQDLVRHARERNAPKGVMEQLNDLPDQEFREASEVTAAVMRRTGTQY